jgi:RNA polymerase sigma-70 factor, ECF subfamily
MEPLDRVQREELLRGAVLVGDEGAWRTWYHETFDDLCRYVRWRCAGRRDWADEIVQETWLTAVRWVRHFDPRQGSFLAWLRGIAANLLRNDLRRRRKLPKCQQPVDGQIGGNGRLDPHQGRRQETSDRQERIAAALDVLAQREEAVLRAKYLEGRSVAEIASSQGDSPKAVESLLSRARQAFRKAYLRQEE